MFREQLRHFASFRTQACRTLVAVLLSLSVVVGPAVPAAQALPYLRVSSKPIASGSIFEVPEKLRPRVNFWKDVFSKYGRQQLMVHHREFPQITFGVLDFAQEAASMSPGELERLKEARSKEAFQRIRSEAAVLASGALPSTPFQKRIADLMAFLPPGSVKYQRLVDEPELLRTQTGIREKFGDSIRRSGRYLPIMERIFAEEFNMPIEVTRLPFIESSFDYTAYSPVGAAGIWQFMPRTGQLYMMVNKIVDERRDPVESTRAAARYLMDAHARLGTWPLAITSYNHGVAGVFKKARKMGTTNLATIIEHPHERAFGFASSNFFPEFLAAIEVYNERQTLFPGLQIDPPMNLAAVRLARPTHIKTVLTTLGADASELKEANLGLSETIWNGHRPIPAGYGLKVPIKHSARLSAIAGAQPFTNETYKPEPGERATYTSKGSEKDKKATVTVSSKPKLHKVSKGETLAAIAKRSGLSISALKEMNGLKGSTVRTGQMLVVSRAIKSSKSTTERSREIVSRKVAQAKLTYKIKKGDTLISIAKKYKKNVSDIKRANNLWSGKINVGKSIVIPP